MLEQNPSLPYRLTAFQTGSTESAAVFIPICLLPVAAGFPPTGRTGSKAAEDGRDDKTGQQSHGNDQADRPGCIAAPALPTLTLMTVGTHS